MGTQWSRRKWLGTVATSTAGYCLSRPSFSWTRELPTAAVAIAQCRSYGAELLPKLATMFDQLGGLGPLVKGKTVAIKLNLTGNPGYRLGHAPVGMAQWVQPKVIAANVHLMGGGGWNRVRLVECRWERVSVVGVV